MKPMKSRKSLSWQAARKKTIDKLFSKPIGPYGAIQSQSAIGAFGRAMNAVVQSQDWINLNVQLDTALSVIRQMVDIMDKLGCNTAYRYM